MSRGKDRRRRLLSTAIAVLLGAVVSVLAVQSAAQAAYVGNNVLRNWETGRCLDGNLAGDVYTLPCSLPIGSNKYQMWEPTYIRHYKSDYVALRNIATNRCITAHYSLFVIKTAPCHGPMDAWDDQEWEAYGTSWGNVVFRKFTGHEDGPFALDSDRGGSVYLNLYNGGGFQHWKFGY